MNDLSGFERAVLGTILAEPERAGELVPQISTDLFQETDCRAVCDTVIQTHGGGRPVDPETVFLALQGLKSCPVDRLALDSFIDCAQEYAFREHVKTLRDARDQRKRIAIAKQIQEAVEAGRDVDGLIAELKDVGREHSDTARRFSLVRVSDMQIREPDFLVDGILERDALHSLFGDPEAGKSFLAVSLACSVASGVSWFGRGIKSAPVVYVAGEGLGGLKRRVVAWTKGSGVECDFPLFFSTVSARVTDAGHVQEVIRAIEEIESKHGAPGLIVLDTLARNFGGLDENATSDMNRFVEGCDTLRTRFRAAILVNHHSGHADKGRGRGSTAFRAALDCEYVVSRDADVVRLGCTKLKDGVRPSDMYFRFIDCAVGIGKSGNEITSAYLEETEPTAFETSKMGPVQKRAVAILDAMYEERERNLSSRGYPPESAVVAVGEFKEAMVKAGIDRRRFTELLSNGKLFKISNGKVRHV